MIRIFTFLILLHIICFSDLLAGTYSGGNGTVGNPYQISTTEDLIELSKTPADWSSHFILTQFISFDPDEQLVDWDDDGTATWDSQDQLGLSPIGNNTTNFTGTFDGQSYDIAYLFINRPSTNNVGLFGFISGETTSIKDLGITNVNITGDQNVGGLVGNNYYGTISNCYSFLGSVSGDDLVGGLVGNNFGTISICYSSGSVSGDELSGGLVGNNSGTISYCYSSVSVSGETFVGGLVGLNFDTISNCYSSGSVSGTSIVGGLVGYNSGTISICYSSGSVSGIDGVGGLVGWNYDGTVSNCYSTGSVSGTYDVSGLVGFNAGDISNCYSSGSVSGTYRVGGLVGYNFGTISNCYSSGSVSGDDLVGGLVGRNESGTISNCYSSGSVSGETNAGGLVGYNHGGTVTNCFWDIETSGQVNSAGGEGKETDDMKTKTTFTIATWNFDTIWNMNDFKNDGYPYLRAFNRIYVDVSATGSNNGKSWRNAYNSLQDALFTSSIGDDIWVAAGTYKPSYEHFLEVGPRGKHFVMKNGVEIYGGFAGTETYLSQRNISANETILSGDLNGDDGPNWSNRDDNCYHVFYHSDGWGLNETAILDGFTITGGNANGSAPHNSGGGIYNYNNSPVFRNCTIYGNRAISAGGGMYNYWLSSPTLTYCTISGNIAHNSGGGLHNEFISSPTLTNCVISGNNSENGSGGLWNQNYSSPTLTNCEILGNEGYLGGGLYSTTNSSPTLTNCTIFGNNAVFGGGVFNTNNTNTTFNNCIIWGNTASGFGNHGKQFYFLGGSTTLNFSCYSNEANDVANFGTFTTTNNNITDYPRFVDPDNGDYRIVGLSPAVDAGKDSYNSEDFDIRSVGFPRKLDKNDHTQVGTIDMGAYEYKEGTDPLGCFSAVYVSDDYDSDTPGWQATHHDNLDDALAITCDDATVNISDYTHTGDVDMTGYTFIIGDGDFDLDGVLSGGLIQTPSTGRLILPAVQNVQSDFPMGNGSNNFTLKIIPMNEPTNPILVRLVEKSVPGAVKAPMPFWEIEGDDDLDATIVFRIDKSAIAPKTLNKNSILRFFDGDKYVPVTEEQVTINDMGSYYEVIIINVNKF